MRVVNVDDPYGRRLAGEHPDAVTFALDAAAPTTARASCASASPARSFVATTPEGELELRTPAAGRFNVANVLGARRRRRTRWASRSS